MSAPKSSFDHEASLDELAGIGRNRRFDEALEVEDFEDIEVVCRKVKTGVTGPDRYEEIPLAKPARAFYFGDKALYQDEALRFSTAEKARILNINEYRNNLSTAVPVDSR